MSTSIMALLAFTALTLALITSVVLYRVFLVFTGKTPANSWTRGAQTWNDPALVTRISHAHLNCMENLPLFAIIVLVAAYTGQTHITDPLACWYLIARFAQSGVHLLGVNHWLVFIRANLIVAQWVILACWLIKLSSIA